MKVITALTERPQYAITVGNIIMGDQIHKTAGRDFFEYGADSHVSTETSEQEAKHKSEASLLESTKGNAS